MDSTLYCCCLQCLLLRDHFFLLHENDDTEMAFVSSRQAPNSIVAERRTDCYVQCFKVPDCYATIPLITLPPTRVLKPEACPSPQQESPSLCTPCKLSTFNSMYLYVSPQFSHWERHQHPSVLKDAAYKLTGICSSSRAATEGASPPPLFLSLSISLPRGHFLLLLFSPSYV